MKKMTVLVSLLVLLAFGGISAYAADTAPAVVINDFGCGVLDANGVVIPADNSHSVVSMDKNGNTVLKCFATVDKNTYPLVNKAVRYNGFGCNTHLGYTTNTKAVITPSGKVMLTCKINPSQ
ncbi:MAG: hypothetical protein KAS90_00075 [Candidatus Aenigmarchaeota archaeon]|nr:hypothetical protein [Candidatus Aenigmarchaeota archaeon]